MALIQCPKCENLISDKATSCPHCGYTLNGSASADDSTATISVVFPDRNENSQKDSMNAIIKRLKIGAIIAAILATCFLVRGFYVKNVYENYSNDEYSFYSQENVNAYVGGDAYNYIINGTYFTGFTVLSGALYVCATGLFCTSLILQTNDKRYQL